MYAVHIILFFFGVQISIYAITAHTIFHVPHFVRNVFDSIENWNWTIAYIIPQNPIKIHKYSFRLGLWLVRVTEAQVVTVFVFFVGDFIR